MLTLSEEHKQKLKLIKDILKDNLSLLVLIPTILGGIVQLAQLVIISPALIRFFSLSQLLIDGLFIVIYFLIGVIIPIYLAYKIMAFTKNLSLTTCFILFALNIIIAIVFMKKIGESEFYSLVSIFITTLISSLIFFVRSPVLETTHPLIDRKIYRLNIIVITIVIIFGFIMASIKFAAITQFTRINNFQKLENKYKIEGKVEILYFNDKYIFIEVQSTKDSSSKIHIEKLESIF